MARAQAWYIDGVQNKDFGAASSQPRSQVSLLPALAP